MQLKGKVIGIEAELNDGFFVVSIKIRKRLSPSRPNSEYVDKGRYEEAMERWEFRQKQWEEEMHAIENLGLREATLIFGDNVVIVNDKKEKGDDEDEIHK